MISSQDIGEFFTREWQAVSAAPAAFAIAVLLVAAACGVGFGLVLWWLRSWTARKKIDQLRTEMVAEDDILDLVRAKHELEVEIREEIEAELARLLGLIERLHCPDAASNQLIADAAAATESAVGKLRQAHHDFVHRMHGWDHRRGPHHLPRTLEAAE